MKKLPISVSMSRTCKIEAADGSRRLRFLETTLIRRELAFITIDL